MNKKKIVSWFKENFQELYNNMKSQGHAHSTGKPHKYHMEDKFWTHTMMVLDKLNTDDVTTIFAALLHDIGKLYTRKENEERASFKKHENVSMYMSIDILKKAKIEFPELDVIKALKFIAWHGDLWEKEHENEELSEFEIMNAKTNSFNKRFGHNKEFFKEIIAFVKADAFGRTVQDEYEFLRLEDEFDFLENLVLYNPNKHKEELPKEVICLIGLSYSGKSTFLKENYQEYEIVSVDKYLEKGKLNYNSINYKKEMKKAHDASLKDVKRIKTAKQNAVIDMTNLTKETRAIKLSEFPSTTYKKIGIVFLNGMEEIEKFAKTRPDKKIDKNVLMGQVFNFELPGMDEFDEIQYLI